MNRAERRKTRKRAAAAGHGRHKNRPAISPVAIERAKARLARAVEAFNCGDHDAAKRALDDVLAVDPAHAGALNLKGLIVLRRGDRNAALDLFAQACERAPQFINAQNNYGNLLMEMGRLDEAVERFSTAVGNDPLRADSYYGRGFTQTRRGEHAAALADFDDAIRLQPRYANTFNAKGIALDRLGRIDEAIESFRTALAIDTSNAETMINLANTLAARGEYEEPLSLYRQALALTPGDPSAQTNASLLQLRMGLFSEGWRNFESRRVYDSAVRSPPGASGGEWRGEPLAGRRILVHGEQGVGDQIFFCSLLRDLIDRSAEVTLVADDRLKPLLSRSFPTLTALGVSEAETLADRDFDYRVALGDVGKWLRPDISSFPEPRAFLVPDQDLTERLRARYRASDERPVIGLAWFSRGAWYGERKSISSEALVSVLRSAEATFVDLQYGDTTVDRAFIESAAGVSIIRDDAIDQMTSLDDFAAQTAAMDAVVTISNTAVHMAGAVGVPSVVMLGKVPLWYWQMDGTDSLWYPRMTLVRQRQLGVWSDVAEAARDALMATLSAIKSETSVHSPKSEPF